MSNSNLVNYTKLSSHCNTPRKDKIKKITIHHMAGDLSVETCGEVFQKKEASSNYGIDSNGRVGMYVEEKNRSWCSSSPDNDHQAITIEVANDGGSPNWHVSYPAITKLIELCVDICKRNGIKELNYTGDTNGNLTRHNMFTATACPGKYLQSKFPYIEQEVNKKLQVVPSKLYRVQTGAFSQLPNAKYQVELLQEKGYDTYIVEYDDLYKVQVGAYSNRNNAEKMADKMKKDGFDTYITTTCGNPVSNTPLKSVEEIAKEVIEGKWGVGLARKNSLEKAGYDYNVVQSVVNKLL